MHVITVGLLRESLHCGEKGAQKARVLGNHLREVAVVLRNSRLSEELLGDRYQEPIALALLRKVREIRLQRSELDGNVVRA